MAVDVDIVDDFFFYIRYEPVYRPALVTAQQAGYFENTVVGKMTEPWVAVLWATFIMYSGRPKCM